VVTGGLGFIGSSLAVRLVRAGARVTVVDAEVPGCGANWHNLAPVAADLPVIVEDIANAGDFSQVLHKADLIFNLAGEISHIHSMHWPARDGEINTLSQLRFLDECARHATGMCVVYASTRQIFGAPRYLPVDEAHPVLPVDFNGIHKYAAAEYHCLYSELGRIDGIVLNLTNVYGPRMALNVPCQGFLSNFLRRALFGQTIEIFGDGQQLRDPVYIDDVTDAFLLAGLVEAPQRRVFNVGGPEALPLTLIADTISSVGGAPAPVLRPRECVRSCSASWRHTWRAAP
jgi:UDP-glucose 4-epimerase